MVGQWPIGQLVNSSSAAVKKSRSIVVVHAAVVIVTIPLIDRWSMVDGPSIFTQRVNNVRSLFTFLLMTRFQFALVPVSFSALSDCVSFCEGF
jgi:hypothetical protein